MKEKKEIETEGRAVFYAVLYSRFREVALECGYALALHGSMADDMDLIAVAWVEDAKPVKDLVSAINDCIGKTVWKDHNLTTGRKKPHGRISYTLSILGAFRIDLAVIPPKIPTL